MGVDMPQEVVILGEPAFEGMGRPGRARSRQAPFADTGGLVASLPENGCDGVVLRQRFVELIIANRAMALIESLQERAARRSADGRRTAVVGVSCMPWAATPVEVEGFEFTWQLIGEPAAVPAREPRHPHIRDRPRRSEYRLDDVMVGSLVRHCCRGRVCWKVIVICCDHPEGKSSSSVGWHSPVLPIGNT